MGNKCTLTVQAQWCGCMFGYGWWVGQHTTMYISVFQMKFFYIAKNSFSYSYKNIIVIIHIKYVCGNSLVIQWLGLRVSLLRVRAWSLVGELRCWKLCAFKKKKKLYKKKFVKNIWIIQNKKLNVHICIFTVVPHLFIYLFIQHFQYLLCADTCLGIEDQAVPLIKWESFVEGNGWVVLFVLFGRGLLTHYLFFIHIFFVSVISWQISE